MNSSQNTSTADAVLLMGRTPLDKRPAYDQWVLSKMREGSWWAACKLASELKTSRPSLDNSLRRLKRRGLVETGGQLWRALPASVSMTNAATAETKQSGITS